MPDTCPKGHPIRSSADRYKDGWCKLCRKAKSDEYRLKQKAALDFTRALEAHGVIVDLETMTVTMRDPK